MISSAFVVFHSGVVKVAINTNLMPKHPKPTPTLTPTPTANPTPTAATPTPTTTPTPTPTPTAIPTPTTTPTPTSTPTPVSSNEFSGIFVPTWDGVDDGFSSIDWSVINWLCVFTLIPETDGAIYYDISNTSINYAAIVTASHSHGDPCFVCLGGSLSNPDPYPTIINTPSIWQTLITNTIFAAHQYRYNGIVVDFECQTNGDFNGAAYADFVSEMTAQANSAGLQVYVCWAAWQDSSTNPTLLEPVCNKLMDTVYPSSTSDNTTSLFESQVSSDAALVQHPQDMVYGFIVQTQSGLTEAQCLSDMQYLVGLGYGMFYWETAIAVPNDYATIYTALNP